MQKKKVASKSKWIKIPKKSLESWISDYLVASMVVGAYHEKKRLPKYIRLTDDCIEEQSDGSGLLKFEVK